ncbi:MAG: glycosyltransferase family 4 protein [Planctomycetota bacterium]
MNEGPLHVCVFGTWRREYSRNRIVHEGLRRNGVKVTECHARLWRGIEDRVDAVEGGWRRIGFLVRVVVAYARAILAWLRAGDHDVLMVGYPGQFDVFLARVLATLRGRPLVMDVFMSIWLVARERGLSGATDVLRAVERTALSLPDRLLHDTARYVDWLHEAHGTDPGRFRLVPTGADDRLFAPTGAVPADDGVFRVLFHGTFIPNHGVETIVHAARLLRDEADIRLEFVGDGPTRPAAEEIARNHALENVVFAGWMEPADLAVKMETSHVCLGSFGTTPQSLMTVQNKIFEGLAMARPVISGDGPAVRDALVDGRDLLLVGRRDPAELAAAILRLRDEPGLSERLAAEGHRRFRESYTVEAIGRTTRRWLEELLPARRRANLTR